MSLQLPVAVERYVEIANSDTPDAAPECFAPDAIVRDEGRTYEGMAAFLAMQPVERLQMIRNGIQCFRDRYEMKRSAAALNQLF